MASLYCRACKAKISQGYNACPNCGAPVSRIIPIIFAVLFTATGILLFSAYKEASKQNETNAPNNQSATTEGDTNVLQTGLSTEE